MCYEAKCSSCGKTTWQGCGRHVPAVYSRIPAGQHCQCKPWPGVTPAADNNTAGGGAAAANSNGSSSCVIL